ncbi:MAG: hypothetical protein RL662_16 [Bacteroidota bacterium]|jgi:hypothetical protein
MKNITNTKIYIFIIAILVCVIAAFLIRFLFGNDEIQAFVSSTEIFEEQTIVYSDSTYNAEKWLWEFGNGDVSTTKSGEYTYKHPGVYQLRITVNNSLKEEILIKVKESIKLNIDSLIRINAPDLVMQDEIVVFKGVGPSKEWRWSFGETGIVDSREQTAIYSFTLPGVYEVELMTEDTKYPIRHQIEVLPQYAENDTTDVLSLIGNDIRVKLQAIVDGEPFNINYNYVMDKYLCKKANTQVVINNQKKNDFYSYCQGLRIIGRKNTKIHDVIVVQNTDNSSCVDKLYVTQSSIND